jgi:hypothetical protein
MHPALLKASGWRYNQRYREIDASVKAGCAGTWDDLPKHKRVDILAWYEVNWRIDAVNSWEAVEKASRGRKKRGH